MARLQRVIDEAILTERPSYWQDSVCSVCFVTGILSFLAGALNSACLYAVPFTVVIYTIVRVAFRRHREPDWASRLQRELLDYPPANRAAYDRLMVDLKTSENGSPDSLRQWLIEERMAIACVGPFATSYNAGAQEVVNNLKGKKTMSETGTGINTVTLNGEVIHITELDPAILCAHWSKLKLENRELRKCINSANSGWRGAVLRLIGIRLLRSVKTRLTL